jgi:hypothetical protein
MTRMSVVSRLSSVLIALLLAFASVGTHAAPPAPILVELFTSEGCSDCPPADALLEKLIAGQPNVIGLGQHVDYWDRFGWKDRFSSAALTNRQRQYAAHFNTESIYTPQMVVDGRVEFVGSDAAAATRAIARAVAASHGIVALTVDDTGPSLAVKVTATDLPPPGRGDRAEIIVAVTEDHLRSDVSSGENHGRVLAHTAVVRHMAAIGQAGGDGSASARADIPVGAGWKRDALKIVAFVQQQRGRAILASAAVELSNARR